MIQKTIAPSHDGMLKAFRRARTSREARGLHISSEFRGSSDTHTLRPESSRLAEEDLRGFVRVDIPGVMIIFP